MVATEISEFVNDALIIVTIFNCSRVLVCVVACASRGDPEYGIIVFDLVVMILAYMVLVFTFLHGDNLIGRFKLDVLNVCSIFGTRTWLSFRMPGKIDFTGR